MTFAADSVSATPFRGGFATLNPPLGHSKAREEEKLLYDSSRANNVRPYHMNLKYSMQPKEKIKALSAFSFAIAAAKEKAIKKKSADMRFRALRSTCPVSATPTAFAPRIGQFPPYHAKLKYSRRQNKKMRSPFPSANKLPNFRAQISTARFAIAQHGTAVNPSRRLSVLNL